MLIQIEIIEFVKNKYALTSSILQYRSDYDPYV